MMDMRKIFDRRDRCVLGGIGVALAFINSACTEDRCFNFDPARTRIVSVCVDNSILMSEINAIGDCTTLVEVNGNAASRCWETEMTGPIGSTCTVRVASGTKIQEATTELKEGVRCDGYPGAAPIQF